MPKLTGLSGTIQVADAGAVLRNIGTDITNYAFTTPRGTQDVTGMNVFAHQRLLLLTDFTVTFNGIMDNDPNLSHSVFSTIPSSTGAAAIG